MFVRAERNVANAQPAQGLKRKHAQVWTKAWFRISPFCSIPFFFLSPSTSPIGRGHAVGVPFAFLELVSESGTVPQNEILVFRLLNNPPRYAFAYKF